MSPDLNSLLVSAFLFAFSVFPTVRIDTVDATSPILGGPNNGIVRMDADNIPHIYLADWDTLPPSDSRDDFTNQDITLVHEILHVADRADDGLYNGSLEPGGCNWYPKDCAHSWVYWAFAHQVEATAILDARR